MREKDVEKLIRKYRGTEYLEKYSKFQLEDYQPLADSAKALMSEIPPAIGHCALMSATWSGYLLDNFDIPSIVVAGDLKIGRKNIFKCKKNVPSAENGTNVIREAWDGHCWIEIDGYIGDLSIFRTAYALSDYSVLKNFILSNFGPGKGAMLSKVKDLPVGMKYTPKYVLTDKQINGLINGMGHYLENSI